MSYHLIKSPAKLSAGGENAGANCGGGGDGEELLGGVSSAWNSWGGDRQESIVRQTGGGIDKFTGWMTEVTWIVFLFSFSLAVAVLLVLWWCSRRRGGGEFEDTEDQDHRIYRNQSLDKGYLLRGPVTLYKSNEKITEDTYGVLNKGEDEGKGDM